MTKEIIVKPIGRILTPFKSRDDLKIPPFKPESPYNDPGVTGVAEVYEEYCEGIADIEPNSKAMLIFHFDKSTDYKLTVEAAHFDKPRGVFSTRSPNRPNGIGVTIVDIISVDKCRIVFSGVDMLDNTPLLDIKPYAKD